MEKSFKVIVIGAGPAGMMAAGTIAQLGADVLLLEKNDRLGKKLLITGKGRCNVTNNCEIDNLMANIPVNNRFLYSAFSLFSPADTMHFFESRGCPLKTERGNRVFPVSDNAYDIVDTLVSFCKENGVKIKKENVNKIIIKDGVAIGVDTADGTSYYADHIIIACGGSSYPGTGSDGSGFALARAVGHTVTQIKPSLVPLTSKSKDCPDMMGLSLKNVSIKVKNNSTNKIIYTDFGEMLFTHFGLSGPIILSASSHMRDMSDGLYSIIIDLKPALDQQQLDKRLVRDFSEKQNWNFSNALSKLLPAKMIPVVVKRSGIAPDTKVNSITKEQRKALVEVIKSFKVKISGFRPIQEAIITSGGVDVTQINPKTMGSKLVDNLYFAGEVIDVDAHTGGYNLQIAFSTGYAAAQGVFEKQYEY